MRAIQPPSGVITVLCTNWQPSQPTNAIGAPLSVPPRKKTLAITRIRAAS